MLGRGFLGLGEDEFIEEMLCCQSQLHRKILLFLGANSFFCAMNNRSV